VTGQQILTWRVLCRTSQASTVCLLLQFLLCVWVRTQTMFFTNVVYDFVHRPSRKGDEEEKARMEERVAAFDPAAYWSQVHPHLLSTIAYRNRLATAANPPSVVPSVSESRPPDPHDGRSHCWQLTETLLDFLARLPPPYHAY
jgi:Domain of unknown function (DUF1917)